MSETPSRVMARLRKGILVATGFLAVAVTPVYLDESYLRVGLTVMAGAVGAIGLTLLLGHCGQLSLAHGFFMLVGATSYVVLSSPGGTALVGVGMAPPVALILAVALSAGAGLLFAPVAGRLRGIYLGLASLGLIFIGLYVGQRLVSLTGGTASGRPVPVFDLFGLSFGSDGDLVVAGVPFGRVEKLWYLFAVLLIVGYVSARRAVRGRPGRAWRAVRDGEASAAALGINVQRAKAAAFAVSSAYAGLAGVLTVLSLTLLKPDESEYGTFGIDATIAVLAMVIIGGTRSLLGAMVGAILVAGFPLILTLLMPSTTGSQSGAFTPVLISQLMFGVALVAVMLLEPRGLAGVGARIGVRAHRASPTSV